MEREKRSSKFGSRLSSIFASLDYSHTQQEHEARSIQSKLSSGSLNPLSKPPLNNVSSVHLPLLQTLKRDLTNYSPSDSLSVEARSNENASLSKQSKKLTRKPPPPDDDLNLFSNPQEHQAFVPHLQHKDRKHNSSVDTNATKPDSLDAMIGTLEDEINQMMNPLNASRRVQDDFPIRESKDHLPDPNEELFIDANGSKPSLDEFAFGVSEKSLQSQPFEAGSYNQTPTMDPGDNKAANQYPFPPTAGVNSDAPLSPSYSVPSSRLSADTGNYEAGLSDLHQAYQMGPNSQVSVDSLHFAESPDQNIGEPLQNFETTLSSLQSSMRRNLLSGNQSEISMSLIGKATSQNFLGPLDASSQLVSTPMLNSEAPRSHTSLPRSPYPNELLHEVLTTGSSGGNVASNASNPALERTQSAVRTGPANLPTRYQLRNAPTFSPNLGEPTIPKALVTSTPPQFNHRKSLSISSIFSTNSNRHITLGALKKSITLRPGEGERSNYVQTVRRNAGTSYNDLGPETWKLPVGILPVDKRQLAPTNDRYNRLRGSRKNQSSGVGLKHGHLAPRLLAAEVDESEGLNKFGSLGRSSTFQRHESKKITPVSLAILSVPSTIVSRGNSLRQNSNAPSRTGSFAGSELSSIIPSTPFRDSGSHIDAQPQLSRQTLVSSRVSVGSVSEGRFLEGYYQHPGYRYEEEIEETDRFSPSTDGTMHNGFEDDGDDNKPRLVLANPDSESSDND